MHGGGAVRERDVLLGKLVSRFLLQLPTLSPLTRTKAMPDGSLKLFSAKGEWR